MDEGPAFAQGPRRASPHFFLHWGPEHGDGLPQETICGPRGGGGPSAGGPAQPRGEGQRLRQYWREGGYPAADRAVPGA